VKTLRALHARKVPFRYIPPNGLEDPVQQYLREYLRYKTPREFASLECLVLAGADVRTLTASYTPAIVSATLNGDLPLLTLLLENGADPNFTDVDDETALAAVFDRLRGQKSVSVEAVRMLLEKGAKPNVTLFEKNLVVLAFENFPVPIEAVRLLVNAQKGVLDLSKWDFFGFSPLDKCATYDDVECVRYLLTALPANKARDEVKKVLKTPPRNAEILKLLQDALKAPPNK
jgi:ankyrin repeat protein